VCTGNENSKPIWNKFIIRKGIVETSQVVLNFCRTVYIDKIYFLVKFKKYNNHLHIPDLILKFNIFIGLELFPLWL
jgi:hypothetical protein